MKINSWLLILPTIISIFCSTAFSQKDNELDKYKFRTLSEITMLNRQASDEILKKAKLEEKSDFVSFDLYYSRARIQFTGISRPISQNHKELIKTWGKLQNVDQKFTSLYENELLFKECNKEFWIPMQKKDSDNILKKVKTDEMITLFVIHVGGRKAAMSKEYDWLFLSTAFEK